MARREIPLEFIGDFAEEQVNKLITATVLETDKRVKLGSPVKTGRFRASWQIGQNSSPGQPRPPAGDGAVIPSPPPQYVGYPGGTEHGGNTYHIHNNLPYAARLADGWSPQADAGWVDLIAKEMKVYIDREYNRIKRNT